MSEAEQRSFFRRTCLATGLIAAVVALWMLVIHHTPWALSWLAGGAVGTGALYLLLEFSLALTTTDSRAARRKKLFLILQPLKYVALGVALYLLIIVWHAEPISLTCGISLPLVVMLLRLWGRQWSEALSGDEEKPRGPGAQ